MKQRGAVIYRYLADLSYADIGELLGCSAPAARRSASDGIASLRRQYPKGPSNMTDTVAPGDRRLIDSLRTAYDDALLLADDRLHARLTEEAEQTGLLDIAYRTVDSPIGSLLLAATPAGLVRVAFDLEGYDAVLAHLAEAISPRVLRAPRRLDGAASQLEEYFSRPPPRVRPAGRLAAGPRVPTLRTGPSPGHPLRRDG